MAEPFIGEIRIFGLNFPPRGWAGCDGQLLNIAQNTALFSILRTTYGGDGQTVFGLPDLRGRFPTHFGAGPGLSNRVLGQPTGTETETLTSAQLPSHTHPLSTSVSSATADLKSPEGNVPASVADDPPYAAATDTPNVQSGNTGGGQSHPNMPPFLSLNFCIALTGTFPSE